MGYDTWGDGNECGYLESCRASLKYTMGQWYVLESKDLEIISSLILYKIEPDQYGIGSIAAPKIFRKQGHATTLISGVVQLIEADSPSAPICLYSDIEPEFYGRFNFVIVPSCSQRYDTSTCMVRGKSIETFSEKTDTPEYI